MDTVSQQNAALVEEAAARVVSEAPSLVSMKAATGEEDHWEEF